MVREPVRVESSKNEREERRGPGERERERERMKILAQLGVNLSRLPGVDAHPHPFTVVA